MSEAGLTRDERSRLGDALHEAVDGDFLVAAGMRAHNAEQDVPLSEASIKEVIWWAVNASAGTTAAIVAAREQAAYERGAADVRAAALAPETERAIIRMAALGATGQLGDEDPGLATFISIEAARLLAAHRNERTADE